MPIAPKDSGVSFHGFFYKFLSVLIKIIPHLLILTSSQPSPSRPLLAPFAPLAPSPPRLALSPPPSLAPTLSLHPHPLSPLTLSHPISPYLPPRPFFFLAPALLLTSSDDGFTHILTSQSITKRHRESESVIKVFIWLRLYWKKKTIIVGRERRKLLEAPPSFSF